MKSSMTPPQLQRLTTLEKVIKQGQKTFVEVGEALQEILNSKLYRQDYSTFEEYCRKRWGWGKSYSYNLIDAARVVKELPTKTSTIVDTESKARELSKVPEEERAEVVAAAVETAEAEDRPMTARDIREAAEHVESTPPSKPPSSPPQKPKPKAPVDKTGLVIPQDLRLLWSVAEETQEVLGHISIVRAKVKKCQDTGDSTWCEVDFGQALANLNQTYANIERAKPYAVCPTCQGLVRAQCGFCRGRGFISEFLWKTCVPQESKDSRAKQVEKQ